MWDHYRLLLFSCAPNFPIVFNYRPIIHIELFFIGVTKQVGNAKSDPPADIALSGPGYYQKHATVKFIDGKISITSKQGKVCVNGKEIKEKKSLHHNDRWVMSGGNAARKVDTNPQFYT